MRNPIAATALIAASLFYFLPRSAQAVRHDLIDINGADQEELLDKLPHATTVWVKAVMDHRPYADMADLKRRSGVPAKVLEQWGPMLKFNQALERPSPRGDAGPVAQALPPFGGLDDSLRTGGGGPGASSSAAAPAAAEKAFDRGDGVLTNEKVIDFVHSGIETPVIISVINDARRVRFDLSTSGILGLSRGGVQTGVIRAMMAKAQLGTRKEMAQEAQAASPATISLGQTPDQVLASMGPPQRIIKMGTKQIYYYKDMKITFTNGKVADVQ